MGAGVLGGAYLASALVLGLGDEAAVSVHGGMAGGRGGKGPSEERFCGTHKFLGKGQ